MADKQAKPRAVNAAGALKFQRGSSIGPFGRSFVTLGTVQMATRGVKAVWRNDVGQFTCAHMKAAAQ